jgi:nucleoside-diphosphate-sugar epimerase
MATALRPGSPGLGTTNTNALLRIDGTRKLLEAALAAGVERYVQQSIVMSYPDGGDRWLDESTPLAPAGERAATTQPVAQMEAMVRAISLEDLSWCILRGGSFVGPDTFQDALIARLREGTQQVPGDGANWVSFVHVADYAEAVALALDRGTPGLILNINDEPIRNGEYLDGLAARLGVPAPPRDRDAPTPRSYRCTNHAARAALGWQPTHGIWPSDEQLAVPNEGR